MISTDGQKTGVLCGEFFRRGARPFCLCGGVTVWHAGFVYAAGAAAERAESTVYAFFSVKQIEQNCSADDPYCAHGEGSQVFSCREAVS